MQADHHVFDGVVPGERAGERFDVVAAGLVPHLSRGRIVAAIRSGAALLDGRVQKPAYRVRGGERILIHLEEQPRALQDLPQPVAFEVAYEDEHLIVVDKPPGLVVHPGAGNADGTLVNGLLARRPDLAALPRAGIVHRLDKDTSGLMVVAATEQVRQSLVRAIQRRAVDRIYMAVVEGVMIAGRDIDLALGRDSRQRLRWRARDDGRPALTHVRVVARYRAHTLVRAKLETGRTHQVRAHMSAVGHPLVGDRRYGARGRLPKVPSEELVETIRAFPRQALHARCLGFEHPVLGSEMRFESPVPADIASLVRTLKADADVVHPPGPMR
ncbi:MAG: RluA family pseudouridine synthase [Gammaproteobacteria bacterium]|nr:RluA family pseudouridine synthase [Gammaproteobacteria bacterium]